MEVEAELKTDSKLYKSYGGKASTGKVTKGTSVIYLRDKQEKWAYIRLSNGTTGWVPRKALIISQKNYTGKQDLTSQEKDEYVNLIGYKSKTDYLIWVNLERQKLNVFKVDSGKWKLVKSFNCSSGKNSTPTYSGEFEHSKKVSKWKFNGYYVKSVMVYYDSYAIHSLPYRNSGKLLDNTLGTPASHGCIRVSESDLAWLNKTISKNTKIIIR